MTYDDIIDWVDESYDPERYDADEFEEWISDIIQDFNNQNHFFPEGVIDDLSEHWKDVHDTEIAKESITEARIQALQEQSDFNIRQLEKIQKKRKETVTVILKDKARQKEIVKNIKQNRQDLLTENKKLQRENKKLKAEKAELKRQRRKERSKQRGVKT